MIFINWNDELHNVRMVVIKNKGIIIQTFFEHSLKYICNKRRHEMLVMIFFDGLNFMKIYKGMRKVIF